MSNISVLCSIREVAYLARRRHDLVRIHVHVAGQVLLERRALCKPSEYNRRNEAYKTARNIATWSCTKGRRTACP